MVTYISLVVFLTALCTSTRGYKTSRLNFIFPSRRLLNLHRREAFNDKLITYESTSLLEVEVCNDLIQHAKESILEKDDLFSL